MEEKAPEQKMSISDVPDVKVKATKECLLEAPLRSKLEMGPEKLSLGAWKEKVCIRENCAHDQHQQKDEEDLIKEIATLEMQVVQLEQHLLSLYRKKFDQQDKESQSISERCVSGEDKLNYSSHLADRQLSAPCNKSEFQSSSARFCSEHYRPDMRLKMGSEKWGEQKIQDSSINRTHSSLSGHFGATYSTIQRIVAEATQCDHSPPLSMFEGHDASSGAISQGRCFDPHETPNWISEEMVKCISTIYCTLSDSSPFSFTTTLELPLEEHHSLGSHLANSFVYERSRFSGTYSPFIEVKHISPKSKKLGDSDHTLRQFRTLVHRLNKVDPIKLKHREKLAFWINVHNALVMHALLVYGIPQNNLKRTSLVLKAAYNVGGQTVNVEMIQKFILRCRVPCPGQWFHSIFYRRTKFKPTDPRRLFATDHAEPLLYFALCAGTYADPAVRIYTPERVYQELEVAKDDYIQLGLRVQKEHRIFLPKTVELFVKDCDLTPAGFVELLDPFLPSSVRQGMKQKQRVKVWKSIQWIPHNFDFRYLFSRELVA